MMWKFVNTGLRRGAFNMEYDEYLAKRLLEGNGSPTVRVYGWEPYAISLGYNQKEHEVDIERSRAEGIDIVRRPTGGRAILHAHELTYSVVMFTEGRSVMETYAFISKGLVTALHFLGVDAEISPGDVNFSELYKPEAATSCFASTSRYEVHYRGKKIVGSAQRRYGPVLLQHGSLLLGTQHRQLAQYMVSPRKREIIQTVLQHRTIEVETILGRPVFFREVVEAVRKGFETAFEVECNDQGEVVEDNGGFSQLVHQ